MTTTGLFCLGLALAGVVLAGCASTQAPGPSFSLGEFVGPRARLHGTVFINGEPAREHYVAIWWNGNGIGIGPLNLPIAVLSDDGRYDFGVIPAGRIRLVLRPGTSWNEDQQEVLVTDSIELVDGEERAEAISLEAKTVSGRVLFTDGWSPVSGADVTLSWRGWKEPLPDGTKVIAASLWARTDESGEFRIRTVLCGPWGCTIYLPRTNIADEDHRVAMMTEIQVGEQVREKNLSAKFALLPWFWPGRDLTPAENQEAHATYMAKHASDGSFPLRPTRNHPFRWITVEFDGENQPSRPEVDNTIADDPGDFPGDSGQ